MKNKEQAFADKSETLADKMNKLTEKFELQLDTATEVELVGDDVLEHVKEKTKDINLYTEDNQMIASSIVNLDNMVSDFKYVRETLKENIDNGRRVLNTVTINLLDADDDTLPQLIVAFAELNKAIAENTKIYLSSYKSISDILLNLDKIKKAEKEVKPAGNITNNLTINGGDPISTVDLIKQLSNKE